MLTCLLWGWKSSCLHNHLPPPGNFRHTVTHLQQWQSLFIGLHLTGLLGPKCPLSIFPQCRYNFVHSITSLASMVQNQIGSTHFQEISQDPRIHINYSRKQLDSHQHMRHYQTCDSIQNIRSWRHSLKKSSSWVTISCIWSSLSAKSMWFPISIYIQFNLWGCVYLFILWTKL